MKNYNIADIFAASLSRSELFQRKSPLIIALFLFLSSLFAGVFFSLCISTADKEALAEPVRQLITSGNSSSFPSMMTNLMFLLLIYITGLSLYGFAFSLLILAGKSLALGFCGGLIYNTLGKAGTKILLLSLIPVNLILMTAFVLSTAASVSYAILIISGKTSRGQHRREYTLLFVRFALLIVIASLIEAISFRLI